VIAEESARAPATTQEKTGTTALIVNVQTAVYVLEYIESS